MSPPAAESAPLEFNPLDPAFIADPYPFYRRLREQAPVFKAPQGFWLITRYEDTAFVLRDKRFGKDFVGNMERRYGGSGGMNEPAIASLAHTMLVQNAKTLEDLVKEMLRPMLQHWLDNNLPTLVERLVRQEIERVARGRG